MANSKPPILIVDDEPEMLFSLRGLLRLEFEVHTVESGSEALQILKEQSFHVVMADQRMPEVTGVELLSQVMGEWPDTIRIVFTGYADVKAVIDAINQGHIYRYITKPWDSEELRAVLHQACDEYDRRVAHRRLLKDLREHQARCLDLLTHLKTAQTNALTPGAREEAARFATEGTDLLERLDQALSSGQEILSDQVKG